MLDLTKVDVVNLLTGLKAKNTILSYSANFAAYLEFAAQHKSDPAHADTMLAYRKHLIHDTQISPNTINLRLHSVKSVFRELAEQRLVTKETYWAINDVRTLKPNALPERRNQNFRVRIEPEQMREIVEAPNVSLDDPYGARNRALVLVLATSGMRISEATHIKVKDVQKRGGAYLIANVLGKGASSTRVAPLSEEAYLAIQDWLFMRPLQSEWLFTSLSFNGDGAVLYAETPMSRQSANGVVKRIGAQIGVPEIKPHDFRRFVGTQLAKSDIRQAQRVLGHKSINTTAQHYVLDDVPLGSTEGLF